MINKIEIEAKSNEIKLLENVERLSLATISNGIGIWDFNLKTQQLVWDDSMYALYRMRKEDFSSTYDAWTTSLHPGDHERCNQEVQDAISGKSPFDTKFRVLWPNGEIRNIKAVAKVFNDDSGKPVRMLGTNIDITQQELAEQSLIKIGKKLERERIHLEVFIKAIPDLVWLKDANGIFLNCNSRVESFYGVKAKDIVGKTDYDFVDKGLADSFRLHDLAAMQSNIPLVNEEKVTFFDGHTELLETTKTAMFDPKGVVIGVLGIGHNITERKKSEEKLRESEERLKVVLEGSSDGVWEYALQTVRILYP